MKTGIWCFWSRFLPATKHDLHKIMSKLSGLADQLAPIVTSLGDLGTQLEKAKLEIIASLSDVEIPPAAQEKIDALSSIATSLKATGQALDDLNPDAPTTT